MFRLEVFRKQMYYIEESTCGVTLLGLFGARGIVPPRYAPVWLRRV